MSKIRMQCPEGMTCVNVLGQEFRADRNGVVEVPAEAESTLYSFGLLTIGKNVEESSTSKTDDTAEGERTSEEPVVAETEGEENAGKTAKAKTPGAQSTRKAPAQPSS